MVVSHANYLASIGHEVSITTAEVNTVFYLNPRVSIVRLSTVNKLATIFTALTSRFPSDLVIADIIPMSCFTFIRNRRKVIYFAQDYDESYYTSVLLKRLVRFFYVMGLKFFRIPVIAVSKHLADRLSEHFDANVTVVENGVDTEKFFRDPDPELVESKENRKSVILFSRKDHRKGFDIGCSVVTRLTESHRDMFEIWTVGEQSDGMFPGIVHRDFGYVGEEKLRQLFSSADMFLYPSRHEGFGLMPLEAMACRCPLVTTTAVPYAKHESNALVAGVEDVEGLTGQSQRLLDDNALYLSLSDSGYRYVARHTLAESTRLFAGVCADMVQ
ncbi:MAG: glycosyltransferase family 4 protein [Desulfuromonadales bacterium]